MPPFRWIELLCFEARELAVTQELSSFVAGFGIDKCTPIGAAVRSDCLDFQVDKTPNSLATSDMGDLCAYVWSISLEEVQRTQYYTVIRK